MKIHIGWILAIISIGLAIYLDASKHVISPKVFFSLGACFTASLVWAMLDYSRGD